jgi:hypothetical protein
MVIVAAHGASAQQLAMRMIIIIVKTMVYSACATKHDSQEPT